MTKQRALIIEDEVHCQEHLAHLISQEKDEIEIIAICKSISEAKVQLAILSPDLLFLDVHLGDGTAFDLLADIDYKSYNIIFTTSDDSRAVQAFQLNAVHYLIKPVLPEELTEALSRIKVSSISNEEKSEAYKAAANGAQNALDIPPIIRISSTRGFKVIQVEDIVHLEADEGYTRFRISSEDKVYTSSYGLKTYEFLEMDNRFFKAHRGHIINLLKVNRYDGKFAHMDNNTSVPISERKKASFRKAFDTTDR